MVNNSKEKEITGNIKLIIDKDFNKLIRMSEKTGVPLTFRGDRIIDFKINGVSNHNNIKPDLIKIGPAAVYFDLKFGESEFKDVPFDKIIITDDTVVLKSLFYSKLDFNLKIKFRFDKINKNMSLNITFSPKSNKIKDILHYEYKKRAYSNKTFQLIPNGNEDCIIEGKLPFGDFNECEIKFYRKLCYINEKLNLNLMIDEDYIISNDDRESIDTICSFIKDKKIKLNNISLSMKTHINTLKEIITQEKKQALLKQDQYTIKLLGNEINLGQCKVKINKYKILNIDELQKIYNNNKDNDKIIEFKVILKEYNSDELYLDFRED